MISAQLFILLKMSDTVHIEIYLKESEKTVLKYEVEDNDKNVLFSTYLFKESLKDFAVDNYNLLREYSVVLCTGGRSLAGALAFFVCRSRSLLCFSLSSGSTVRMTLIL